MVKMHVHERRTLAQLQEKLRNVNYIITDEFSVIGQRIFTWIDQRLRQASTVMDVTYGGFNVIMVDDTAQLPPV